jgi:hypothetical protein
MVHGRIDNSDPRDAGAGTEQAPPSSCEWSLPV